MARHHPIRMSRPHIPARPAHRFHGGEHPEQVRAVRPRPAASARDAAHRAGPARNRRSVISPAEQATFVEGCLSFNTVAVAVQRPAAVRIVAQDLGGRSRELEGDGFAASLLQREIDHLDGILTLDRADRIERHRAITDLITHDSASAALAA